MSTLPEFNPVSFSPLRMFVNAVLPSIYSEALSYQEVLGKLAAQLNSFVDNLNNVNEQTEAVTEFVRTQVNDLTAAFNTFTNKVNTDFQSLSSQLNQDIEQWETENAAKLQEQYNDFLSKYQKQFGVVQDIGSSVTDVMSQNAVTNKAFVSRIPTEDEAGGEEDPVTLAKYTRSGVYRITAAIAKRVIDYPPNIGGYTSALIVFADAFVGNYCVQLLFTSQNPSNVWYRIVNQNDNSVYRDWEQIETGSIINTMFDTVFANRYRNLSGEVDYNLNNYIIPGSYNFLANKEYENAPDDYRTTHIHTLMCIGNQWAGQYVLQIFTELENGSNTAVWYRYIQTDKQPRGTWVKFRSHVYTNHDGIGNKDSEITKLAQIREVGSYNIYGDAAAKLTDVPIAATSYLVFNIAPAFFGSFIVQFCMNGTGTPDLYYRVLNSDGTVYGSGWVHVATPASIGKNVLPKDGDILLKELTEFGCYGFNVPNTQRIKDGPSNMSIYAVHTLQNTVGFWAGQYIKQVLFEMTSNKSQRAWTRVVYYTNNEWTVWSDWEPYAASIYKGEAGTEDFAASYKQLNDFASKFNAQNVLQGKKLAVAGDSYSDAQFGDISPEYNGKNYAYYIAERNGMTYFDDTIGGSTMAVPSNPDAGDRHPFAQDRYKAIPADTDYLVIWFGINDYANCTLGTIDDTDINTFYGAYNTVLKYYLTERPFMKILLVVTTGADADFRQAIRDVAKRWGYPYLDWEKNNLVPAFFDREGMSAEAQALRRKAFGIELSGLHPNYQWHQYASTIFESFLRSL